MALNILNVNIDKYEQRQCNQLAGTIPIQCGSVGRIFAPITSLHTTGSLCVPADETHRDYPRLNFFFLGDKTAAGRYLGLLLLREIVFDVEGLPDLLGGFAFDHVGHRLAGDI